MPPDCKYRSSVMRSISFFYHPPIHLPTNKEQFLTKLFVLLYYSLPRSLCIIIYTIDRNVLCNRMDLIRYRKMLFDEGGGSVLFVSEKIKIFVFPPPVFVEFLPNLKKVWFSFSPRKILYLLKTLYRNINRF